MVRNQIADDVLRQDQAKLRLVSGNVGGTSV